MRPVAALLLAACSRTVPSIPEGVDERPVLADTEGDTGSGYLPLPGPYASEVAGTSPGVLRQPGHCFLAVPDPRGALRVDVVGLARPARATWLRQPIGAAFTPRSMFQRGHKLMVVGETPSGTELVVIHAMSGSVLSHHAISAGDLETAGGAFFDAERAWARIHRYADIPAVLSDAYTVQRQSTYDVGSGDAWLPVRDMTADVVTLYDPATLQRTRFVTLDSYQGRLRHLQEAGDRLFLLAQGGRGQGQHGGQVLSVYDDAGVNLRNVELARPFAAALSCVAP